MRQVKTVETSNGTRYKVRYRLGGQETSETFVRETDAKMFRDLLGDGKAGRTAEALRWLEARRAPDAIATITFGQWFEEYVSQLTGVTPRTREDYRSLRRRYFGALDPLPLTLLSRSHITSLVNDMETAGRSPKTIKQTINTLSSCFRLAVDEGHMPVNPTRRVRLPAMSLAANDPRFLTVEEAGRLVEATPEHYRGLVTFLLGTGLRWSEATALQIKHINLDAGTVRVEQAWKRIPGQGYAVGPPKTKKARRTVNAAVPALLAVAPLIGKSTDWVFTTKSGGPVQHANFYNNVWKPTVAKLGMDPAPRVHDLRHTHASWLLSDGIGIEAVQDQLGHESMETTRKVYAHLIPAVGVAVGKSASAALGRALAAQTVTQELPLPDSEMLEAAPDDVKAHA